MKSLQAAHHDQTLEDCYKFFATKDGADILSYSYIKAPFAYDNLIRNCEDYYLFKDEIELIKNNQLKLEKYLDGVESIIEIGPGSKLPVVNKTLPLLSYASDLKEYCPLDISVEYLREVCDIVRKSSPRVKIVPIELDIMNHNNFYFNKLGYGSYKKKKACIMLGGTLGNFDERQQKSILQQISNILEPGNLFFITFDTNENEAEILKAYNNQFLFHILDGSFSYFADRYVGVKKWTKILQPQARYDKLSKCVNLFFIATSSFTLNLPCCDTIKVAKNQKLRGVKSQKYTVEHARVLLSTNFATLDILNNSNKMRMFICQKL
jgi:uncharacterized SAM-dependent methyltransferase